MKIKVTSKDIKYGEYSEEDRCPIALSVKRMGFKHVRVGEKDILINKTLYSLPQKARDFIGQFDCGDSVSPFSFSIKPIK